MDSLKYISTHFDEHLEVLKSVSKLHSDSIRIAALKMAQSLLGGGALFWCGNGGSAADSQHLAAELVGRFKKDRRPLRSISLTTDTSVLTCVANDYDYRRIFSRQLEALARPGDVLVAISTSGNSENVIDALKIAKTLGVDTVALLGKNGGLAKSCSDISIIIPSESTARIQEAHIFIGHVFCDLIERELGLA
jgi:D-sedoheptulose 7-phosphate isomerase